MSLLIFFERCNIHHPTPFDGRHQHFRRKANRCWGYSAPPITMIHPRKTYQQRAEAATAKHRGFIRMRLCTDVFFLESTKLRWIRGWRRWIVKRAQQLYWRAPVVAVEATYRGNSYVARAVRFKPVFFSTTILLTGQHLYFLLKFIRTS